MTKSKTIIKAESLGKPEKRRFMNKRQFIALFVVVALLTVLLSGCAGVSRIDSFFQGREFLQHAKLIDFGLFFVIFFAMCYLGFTVAFGKGFGKPAEAKGPIVGLSLALALAFAFAIVTQTSFSITTLFPLAKAMFFLIIFIVLYGLIIMTKIFGDHWGGKVAAAILALMLAYILMSIFTHMVCQMSDNMDDPACQSDFFNAGYHLLGRLLGIEEWMYGGGGHYGGASWSSTGSGRSGGLDNFWGWLRGPGPSGGGGAAPAPRPDDDDEDREEPTGPVQGGCRMDITFSYDNIDPTSSANIPEFVNKAKEAGYDKIYIYGFASEEGGFVYNRGLSLRRANAMKNHIDLVDSSMSSTPRPNGEVDIFGDGGSGPGSTNPNRRVVLSTERLAGDAFVPAPSPGAMTAACDEEEDDDDDEDEDCICPLEFIYSLFGWDICSTNTVARILLCWWWVLLLLLLFVRPKQKVKIEESIEMKNRFLKQLKDISRAKEHAWHAMLKKAVSASDLAPEDIDNQAKQLVRNLDDELVKVRWVGLRKLARRYRKKLHLIPQEAAKFRDEQGEPFDEKHAHLIVRFFRELKHRKQLGLVADQALFYRNLTKVVADEMHNNKVKNEWHEFFRLQLRLKKAAIKFAENERKILNRIIKTKYYKTFGMTDPHLVRKRKRSLWPWKLAKEDITVDHQMGDSADREVIVEVTQEVRDLTNQLIEKIQEVMEEEDNLNHEATTWQVLSNRQQTGKYDQEKALISRLEQAIYMQRDMMAEEWRPFIDDVDENKNEMRGHIHYRRVPVGMARQPTQRPQPAAHQQQAGQQQGREGGGHDAS